MLICKLSKKPIRTSQCQQVSPMMNCGGQLPMPLQPTQLHRTHSGIRRHPTAVVRIIEQPASKALRFRYECEGRSAGSIPGASSTPENKTFPEIQVVGYQGRAVVVVSCVTKDEPYLVHPHNLVGREGCKNGVCTLVIPPETMRVQFSNLGIQCVKKRDIESSIKQRKVVRVDPFNKGYNHGKQPTSIDLNAVRLCFHVFLEGEGQEKYTPLQPVVSDVIYDKKAMSDLSIIKLSDCVSHVDGGRRDIILLCEKVAKEDIEIHFYEERDGQRVWQAKADFHPNQVHKQHAIWFRPPRYHTLEISEPVHVFIQLYRPSDCATSEPIRFQLLPLNAVPLEEKSHKRKRAKTDISEIFGLLDDIDKLNMQHALTTNQMSVKTERRDATSPYGGTSPCGGTSPYGGIMYSANPTNYASSAAHSPHYGELAPTPSPENVHYQYRQQPVNIGNYNIMPANKADQSWNIQTSAPQNQQNTWNFPSTSEHKATQPSLDEILVDLDQINSGDLQNTIQGMNIPVDGPLLDIKNLSLTDIETQNM